MKQLFIWMVNFVNIIVQINRNKLLYGQFTTECTHWKTIFSYKMYTDIVSTHSWPFIPKLSRDGFLIYRATLPPTCKMHNIQWSACSMLQNNVSYTPISRNEKLSWYVGGAALKPVHRLLFIHIQLSSPIFHPFSITCQQSYVHCQQNVLVPMVKCFHVKLKWYTWF